MDSNKIQYMMRHYGVVGYTPPFGKYRDTQYHVIINTLPKFRDNSLTRDDIHLVDDCLLRYLGATKDI